MDVGELVAAAGWWAPVVFLVLYGTVTVAPVPRTVLTVTAGVLFGSVLGLLLAVAAALLAAVLAFGLVRLLGGRVLERFAHHPALVAVRYRLDRSGLLAVASLRLIPALPFSVVNYAAGLSGVRFAPYAAGTLLGTLPGTVAVVVLGDAVAGGSPHPALLAVSVLCGAVGVAGALVAARRPATGPEPACPATS